MKITLNKQIFYNYILAFFGLLMVIYYICFRFLRERLPRDIPFHLQAFVITYTNLMKKPVLKRNIILVSGYLIGWIYILLVNLHTLNLQEILDILNTIKINMDPFLP